MKPAAGAGGAGAVGTSGASGTRYQLDGEDKLISPHVNNQVEITGSLVENSSASPSGGAAAGAERSAAASAGPTLKVESVKMVAAVCS
jgi:hypothetical protein